MHGLAFVWSVFIIVVFLFCSLLSSVCIFIHSLVHPFFPFDAVKGSSSLSLLNKNSTNNSLALFQANSIQDFIHFTHLCIIRICVCIPLQRIGKSYTQFGENCRHCIDIGANRWWSGYKAKENTMMTEIEEKVRKQISDNHPEQILLLHIDNNSNHIWRIAIIITWFYSWLIHSSNQCKWKIV